MGFRLPAFLGFAQRPPQWRSGAGDPVLSVSVDGEVLAATGAAEETIGAEGGLTGRSILDFVAREDRASMKEALIRAASADLNGAAEHVPVRLLRPGRASQFAEFSLVRDEAGDSGRDGPKFTILIRERASALAAERTERAAPAATVSPELLADLGHELKTPLNAIMGFADAMKAEAFGPLGHEKYNEYARHIHSSGSHLADLIASILDRAKLDAGRIQLSPALAEPGAVARECAEMVRGDAEKASLALRVDIAPGLSETMLDVRMVKQILINLLSNAVKFTAAGEIAIRVSETDGALTFAVSDTGVGMSQMALARLGERFTGLHKSGVRGASGTGLGLSLAFSYAKLHGGALDLSSAPGEGTTATLRLPIAKNLAQMAGASINVSGDIQSQLDRVAHFRRERSAENNGRSAA